MIAVNSNQWVLTLREACRQAVDWPEQWSIAVNVSAVQLVGGDVISEVKEALEISGLRASRLHLEITESALLDHTLPVTDTLGKLRSMGVTLALDDFGTGYSSLSYLGGLPLNKLKIDQSFVRKMSQDSQSLVIVQAVNALAGILGLDVVAEGVETDEEARLLKAMGCQVGQGYLYGRPQNSSELMSLMDSRPWVSAA
ncbi:EAL domain-containing protein (plasmid) [Agrobacterium tumefaciens]|nr:EAL domain-containing protein [Agrobacterium tumefaciens]